MLFGVSLLPRARKGDPFLRKPDPLSRVCHFPARTIESLQTTEEDVWTRAVTPTLRTCPDKSNPTLILRSGTGGIEMPLSLQCHHNIASTL